MEEFPLTEHFPLTLNLTPFIFGAAGVPDDGTENDDAAKPTKNKQKKVPTLHRQMQS